MKFKELPSAERLRELFGYDVLKGELFWRETRGGTARAGSVAGCVDKIGYRRVKVDCKVYQAHRLIWKWTYGTDPSGQLDHIGQEGITPKLNNVWNLRELSAREHITITKAYHKGPRLPVGVYLEGNRYQAQITQDRKGIYLGRYDTPEEAHQAYLEALETIESGGKVVSGAKPTSSRFRGVTWDKRAQKWTARATIDGKTQNFGSFLTEIEAHQAACKARSVT